MPRLAHVVPSEWVGITYCAGGATRAGPASFCASRFRMKRLHLRACCWALMLTLKSCGSQGTNPTWSARLDTNFLPPTHDQTLNVGGSVNVGRL